MDCILLRHGIAVPCEEWNGAESERPLTARGIAKTRKAVTGLKHLGFRPTHLLSSPYRRALETAQIVQAVFLLQPDIAVHGELLFGHPPTEIISLLQSLPDEACVMCVGHEPHLGHTASLMVAGKTTDGFSLKKAGACAISFDGKPKPGRGRLLWSMPPGILRQLRKG